MKRKTLKQLDEQRGRMLKLYETATPKTRELAEKLFLNRVRGACEDCGIGFRHEYPTFLYFYAIQQVALLNDDLPRDLSAKKGPTAGFFLPNWDIVKYETEEGDLVHYIYETSAIY